MSSTTVIPDLPETEKNRVEKRLELFYSKHNPENMKAVPRALSTRFTEKELFDKLYSKYNVMPILEEGQARQAGVFPGQQKQKLLCPYTQLPLLPEIPSDFSELFPSSSSVITNDSALYFVGDCKTIKNLSKQSEAILIISYPVIFECTPSGAVSKSFQVTEIEKLIYDEDAPTMLAIVTKDKSINLGDLLVKFDSSETREEVINCLTQLYKAVINKSGSTLKVEKMLFLHPTRLNIKEQSFTTSTPANRRDDLLNRKIAQRNQEATAASPKNHPFKDEGSPKPPPPPSPSPPPPPPPGSATPSPDNTIAEKNLDQLRDEEQRRARKRIELFYANHAPQELEKPRKLDTVMALHATESLVMRNLCTKYRVSEEMEKQQAAAKNLLPKNVETNQNNKKNQPDDTAAWRATTPLASNTSPERVLSPNRIHNQHSADNTNNTSTLTTSDITPIRSSATNQNNQQQQQHLFNLPPISPQHQQQLPCTKCKFLEEENRTLRRQLDDIVDENKQLVDQLEAVKMLMMEMAKMQGIDIPNDLL